MADNNEALILQMSVDLARMEKSLNAARGMTNRQLKAVEDRFDKMNAHVRRSGDEMARDLRASIAAIGIGVAIREVTDYSDIWTTAKNKIAAAGVEQEKLAGTMQRLVTLSKETGTSFEATADLYSKVQRSSERLGLSQEQVLKITEQVNKAFVAGGAAAGEQASGILQLGQALGSGVLQGDELKSLRENAPLLAQAIADEFKTTIAGLKELGAQGELTSDRVAKAILNANGIQEQFARTTRTVAQAMENLRTEFTRYIAESRVAQTVVQALSGFIAFATDNLDALADAAIVAASVIGGALAAGAIIRFVGALGTMIKAARTAATAMQALQVATTFFSGPVGAVILGIGAALGTLALSATDAGDATERARESFDRLEKLRTEITSGTADLEAAQRALTQAIQEGGDTAQISATKEVDRMRRLLDANKALFEVERARARITLNDKSSEYRTKYVDIPGLQELRGFGRSTLQSLDFDILSPALRARKQSIEAFSTDMGQQARIRLLTQEETVLLNISQAILNYRQEMNGLTKQLEQYDAVSKISIERGGILEFPTAPDGKSSGSAGKAYRSDIEKLRDALKDLGDEAAAEGGLIQKAVMAVDSLQQNGDRTASDFVDKLKDANEQLTALEAGAGDRAFERSRRAMQAILDFAANDLPGAFASIPSFGEILTSADTGLLRTELGKMAAAAGDAVSVGVDQIQKEFVATVTAVEQARAAAVAAGITDLGRFDRALQEALANLDQALEDRLETPFPYDMDALTSELATPDLPEFVDQFGELREGMRDAVKQGLEEGIRTDNWGDALRGVLASAIAGAMDDSLNRLADAITNILTGQNSTANNIFAGIAGLWGGPRAGGGGVQGGKVYSWQENGKELLMLGKGQDGQVLNASTTRGLLTGGQGGGSVYAPFIVQGSIDAVTWPKVQQAMQMQRAQIMSAVPGAVNATLTDNRIQKRRV